MERRRKKPERDAKPRRFGLGGRATEGGESFFEEEERENGPSQSVKESLSDTEETTKRRFSRSVSGVELRQSKKSRGRHWSKKPRELR